MSGLLSSILGKPKKDLAGFHLQTSVYGLPIPIVYGTMRLSGNLIHMPAVPVLRGAQQGKLGRISKGAQSGDNYYAPAIIALCEGPIEGIEHVWRDKDGLVQFVGNYDVVGWDASHLGTDSQSPWTFLTSDYPAEAVPYQSTAYLANEDLPFPNDTMSQFSWEVVGFFADYEDVPQAEYDASPADIIPDFLTNPQYGVGWDAAQIGDLTDYVDYCAAAGLFASIAMDQQKPAADWINELCEISNTGLVWSDGVLKFISYGDAPLSANGHTFTPNTTPLYDLTDTDFLAPPNTDPIVITRRDPATVPNQVQVEYRARAFDYNTTTYTAQDGYAIERYGLIALPPLQLPGITTPAVAQQVAQLRLQREQYIRNTYAFSLGWRFSLLDPMELVTLTDDGLGLSQAPVRITTMTESDDEQGFDVTAEDWPFGSASATLYDTPDALGTATNANVDPGDTTTPLIFEGPQQLQSAPLELWIGASGGDTWGGCDVYLSVDNVSFEKVGVIHGKATFGTLTATLAANAAYPSIDTTHTLSVDLTASGGALVAQSQDQFDNLTPLCYLGGPEWVAYRDLSLVSPFNYDLTHLYRGLYGSSPASHSSATPFIFCDTHILRVPWPLGYIGQVLYFKFPAFNIYGGALQDVASVTSVSHTVGQDPIIPGTGGAIPQGTVSIDANGYWTVTIDGPGDAVSMKWDFSTSAFPSDASVISGGTLVSARSFTSASGTPLTNGQTIYITAVGFPGAGGTGTPSESAHIRGTYNANTPAIPQGTVSIDQDGYWSVTADGPSDAASFRYLYSTSSFPADATVIASGTLVAGSRTFSLVNQGPLTFGDTIYITIVSFTDAGGTVGPAPSIHLRGAYQSYTATKTAAYSASSIVLADDPTSSVQSYTAGSDGAVWNDPLPTISDATTLWMFPVLPNGVTILQFAIELYNAIVGGIVSQPSWVMYRIDSTTATTIATQTATTGLGWQTLISSVSELTTGRSYQGRMVFGGDTSPVLTGQERIGSLYVTYTSPDPTASL